MTEQETSIPPFLAGGGEMSRLIAARDWSASLGPLESWPQSLQTAVGLMIHSPVPLVLLWGPDGIMLYNDAYSGFAGNRHPRLLGSKVLEGWPEVAELNAHVMAVGMAGGTLQYKDAELSLNRRGTFEPLWVDLFYSPVIDESGKPGGVIAVVVETTDRVLATRAATAQSTRLAQMFQDAPSFMAQLDGPEHVFSFTNAAYRQLIAHRDVIGRTVRDALPEIAGQGLYELLDQVYASGESFIGHALPVTLQRRPGAAPEQRLLDFIYQPVRDAAGAVTAIFVEGTDVTDSARDAGAVRESARRLAFLDALGREAARNLDADAILATTTRMVGEYLGVSICAYADMDADEDGFTIRGDWSAPGSPSIQGHYSLADFGSLAVANLSAGKPLVVGDNRKELAPQEAATFQAIGVSATICMPLIKQGRLTALMAIHHKQPHVWTAGEQALIAEVTERSWAHVERVRDVLALRASETQFRTMAQAMPNHVWTATPDGLLDWLNDETYRYSGAAPGTLAGNAWTGIVHPDDLDAAALQWEAALTNGEAYQAQFRLRRFDGTWRWHIARAAPIRDTTGGIARWIGTNTDIQEQKESAAALADINATLEQRVVERTEELRQTEEALRQAQKMEAVGQLTGGLAHDFNNLLQGITGALDRVQHRLAAGRTGDVDRFLKAALESANRAAALTHRLLAFSRRQTLDPRPTDINRLIGGMEDLIRRTMGPDIAVEVVGAGGLWPSRVDAPQLESALLNLCINARDAMPDGGKLTIETANKWLDERGARERELPPGQYVSLCVTDTGTGMPPAVIARAFDPFFTTKPLGQGTGLGLSMIYGFVRQSGGQVRVYSEIDKGTTMCLYLPRHFGAADPPGAAQEAAMDRGFGETVLVVDDEATVRMLVAEVLSENFYHVLEAQDGRSAMTLLETDRRIDLLITDVGLPGGMNGRQIADAARALRPGLRILFITGYAENAAVGNGHLEPGMEILAKPFPMSTLANKVREMLER